MRKPTAAGMDRLRRRARAGDATAARNLAVDYRILNRLPLAFQWWVRAIALHENGDDLLEIAYCLQHGVGVRRDREAARGAYERAIRAYYTTAYGQEEARYHLAMLLLADQPPARRRAARLLREANVDDDYPQARALLAQLSSKSSAPILCHCRRYLRRKLGGSARCGLHRR